MPSRTSLMCCLFLVVGNRAIPTGVQRATSTQTSSSDLEATATGYAYVQQQARPVYYVQYTDHGSGYHWYTPNAVHYVLQADAPVAPAISETTPLTLPYATVENVGHSGQPIRKGTANYGDQLSLEPVAKNVASRPLAPYYHAMEKLTREPEEQDVTRDEHVEKDHGDKTKEREGIDEDDREGQNHYEEGAHGDTDGAVSKFDHDARHTGDERSTEAEENGQQEHDELSEHGEKYTDEEHSQHGEKAVTDYKKDEKIDKGEHGVHDEEDEQGYYEVEGGHGKERSDETERHGSHEEKEKKEKSNGYGHSSFHKKGHKSSGYHNVYHKDEYKKETDFYDEDHEKGHFDKHEDFDERYKMLEGDFKKSGRHSSEQDHEDHGKKGWYKKGHRDSQDQGHRAEEGEKSNYENHQHHQDEGGSKFDKTHEFGNDSGH